MAISSALIHWRSVRRFLGARAVRRCLLVLCLPIGILTGTLASAAPAAQRGPNRAGLVVQWGDGRVATACVAFEEPSISGLQLLQRAKLEVAAEPGAGNAAVCKIEQEGCAFPAEPCFCQCQGGEDCRYWVYWHLTGQGWQYSDIGAGSYQVSPGGVEGWAWGNGTVQQGPAPPVRQFDEVCAVPETNTSPPATDRASETLAPTAPPIATGGVAETPVPATPPLATPPPADVSPAPDAILPEAPQTPPQGGGLANFAIFVAFFGGLLAWLLVQRRRS